jgi:hypothetical protein
VKSPFHSGKHEADAIDAKIEAWKIKYDCTPEADSKERKRLQSLIHNGMAEVAKLRAYSQNSKDIHNEKRR